MSLSLDGTTGISASGNITGGNVIASGTLVVGSFAPASVSTAGNITGAYLFGNAALVTGLSASSLTNGTSNVVVASGSNITFAVGGANIINVNSNGINNMLANGVGNIGSATTYFNTIFAKATSAQYADLAEVYHADSEYTPGTVLDFGGTNEVTVTTQSHSTQVAGIVSTNPSYLMNSTLTCSNAVQLALVGRVPCHVVGTIAKGDRLVSSSVPGIATRLDMAHYQPGCIIGKALEDYDSQEIGKIEVAVGRF
jgi:trimeric autotransporter adhesin